jgi:hypothetical protein
LANTDVEIPMKMAMEDSCRYWTYPSDYQTVYPFELDDVRGQHIDQQDYDEDQSLKGKLLDHLYLILLFLIISF